MPASDASPEPGTLRRAENLSALRRFHVLSEYVLRDGLVGHDHRGRILLANTRASETMGYTRDELLAMTILELQEDSDLARAQEIWAGVAPGSSTTLQGRFRRKDGSLFPVETTFGVLEAAADRFYLAILRDITAVARTNEALDVTTAVIRSIDQGVIVIDAAWIVDDVNNAVTNITGYARDEMIGQSFPALRGDGQVPGIYLRAWRSALETGYCEGEFSNRRKNGEVYRETVVISKVPGRPQTTPKYVALIMDSSHLRLVEDLAYHDPLTRLPNRLLFADRLEQAAKQTRRRGRFIAVAYIDLDDFKRVNDDHGHKAGDDLLVTLGERMKLALRDGDTLARIGGDEFAVLLVDLKRPADYEIALSRLLDAAARPVTIGGHNVSVSASIGLALHPDHGADPSLLMQNADAAMYQAKRDGKGRYRLAGTAPEATAAPGLPAADI